MTWRRPIPVEIRTPAPNIGGGCITTIILIVAAALGFGIYELSHFLTHRPPSANATFIRFHDGLLSWQNPAGTPAGPPTGNPPDIPFPTVCALALSGSQTECFTLPPEFTSFSFRDQNLDPNVFAVDDGWAVDSRSFNPNFPAVGYRVSMCKGEAWYRDSNAQWHTYTRGQPICNSGVQVSTGKS